MLRCNGIQGGEELVFDVDVLHYGLQDKVCSFSRLEGVRGSAQVSQRAGHKLLRFLLGLILEDLLSHTVQVAGNAVLGLLQHLIVYVHQGNFVT